MFSTTSIKIIKQYYNNNVIPIALLNSLQPKSSILLLAYIDEQIMNGHGDKILEDKLFNISKYTEKFNTYYANYTEVFNLL